MIKTCSQTRAIYRGSSLRSGVAGLLVASAFMAFSTGAHADVFGAAVVTPGQQLPLIDRITALERELKELRAKNGGSTPDAPGGVKAVAKPKPKLAPLPGYESLPGGGRDERERLLVEKELTHEVLGTINGMLIVQDGDRRLVLTEDELKSFEKKKRDRVIKRFKEEAVAEGDSARVTFPQLIPPPPPPVEGEMAQAGNAVAQARAIEANGGQLPSPPPPAGKSVSPNAAAAAPATAAQHKPASPVKKN